MKNIVLIALASAALTACATSTPEQDAAAAAAAARPVFCAGKDDCEVKWSKALQWVLNNGAYKIQTQTDTMISTMGPLPNDPRPTFTITKVAKGNGAYDFDFRAGCDNMFGCVPTVVKSRASFVTAIMGP